MNTKYYKTTSVEQRKAILAALFALGYVWHKDDDRLVFAESVESRYRFSSYPTLCVDSDGNVAGCDGSGSTCTLEELLTPFVAPPKMERVRISPDYHAEIRAGSREIEVGCQKISIDALIEVLGVWEKLNPKV